MQALPQAPKRAHFRWTVLLFVAALIATTAAPALADHDWASGCNSSGNTCWYEQDNGGGYMQSDHRDSNTFSDYYVGNGTQSIGYSTDKFRNKMNSTHAHVYKFNGYNTELFCVNPGSTVWWYVGGSTYTGSWAGHSGSLGWCRN